MQILTPQLLREFCDAFPEYNNIKTYERHALNLLSGDPHFNVNCPVSFLDYCMRNQLYDYIEQERDGSWRLKKLT
ncbi:MAG: hypothetical protein VW891_17305, partial [Novosphingobium sp.]